MTRLDAMGMDRGRIGLAWLVLNLIVLAGCSGIPSHPQIDDLEPGFSPRLVEAHFEALASIGSRLPGSSGDQAARAYLDQEFRLSGAQVRTLEDGSSRHLIAELPGRSQDVLLFVAPYPVLGSTAYVDDSGAVLLLELARVLGRSPPPYTLRFALAEVRPVPPSERASEGLDASGGLLDRSPDRVRNRLVEAGRSLAKGIQAEGSGFDRLRAVVVFETAARSELRFDRDLRSHPVFREIFWESASSLAADTAGETAGDEIFPPDASWSSTRSLQQGFRERSMDRVLALVDVGTSPSTSPSTMDPTQPAREASFDRIDTLGIVTIDAVNRLMRRFEKVDAFSE